MTRAFDVSVSGFGWVCLVLGTLEYPHPPWRYRQGRSYTLQAINLHVKVRKTCQNLSKFVNFGQIWSKLVNFEQFWRVFDGVFERAKSGLMTTPFVISHAFAGTPHPQHVVVGGKRTLSRRARAARSGQRRTALNAEHAESAENGKGLGKGKQPSGRPLTLDLGP